jgi:transcription antitermination factor NusG
MIPGVHHVVGIAGTPQSIDSSEIEAIRTIVYSGRSCEPHPFLTTGQQVQITEGALAGLCGFIVHIKNEQRLVLSVQLLMRSVSVEIDRMIVEPIVRNQNQHPFPRSASNENSQVA